MNAVIYSGRLTKDIEIKQAQNGNDYLFFTVAVARSYKEKNGEYKSDFINCWVYNEHLINFLPKYTGKGSRIIVRGQTKVDSYKSNGEWVNSFQTIVNEVDLIDTKAEREQAKKEYGNQKPQGKHNQVKDYGNKTQAQNNKPNVTEEDLPF